ncbi:MAG: hypothetical protein VR73_05595 [Gammaproteobacteria bacterium BRH_c0]|nr:MAG: hypothetical protein VR73_05595 [Gammaproteobacteria bacterium BRH_c0]
MQYKSRQQYTPGFKRAAVERSLQSQETIAQVAGKLGVHPGMMTRWRRELMMSQDQEKPAVKHSGPSKSAKQLERQVAALEKKLKRVELENAILKKATEYFTKNTQ